MSLKKNNKPLNKYLRFSSIALQIGVTIYLGNKLGKWLDYKYSVENQIFTKACTLVAVFGAMFSVIMQVSKLSKDD